MAPDSDMVTTIHPSRRAAQLAALCASLVLAAGSQPALAAPGARAQVSEQPCPDSAFTCIRLAVPLDHFDPANARAIDVVFGILPARDPARRKGMLVTAVGGPGASGLANADDYAAGFADEVRDAFDLVFFDQRGIGLSGGFDCPQAVATYYQTDGRARTPAQERAAVAAAREFTAACLAQLPAEDVQFYGTRQAVEDLEAFRRHIGDENIWLYGESYGTQFAQWYAAAHPDHVAGLVLDGVVDLTLSGPEYLRDTTQAFNAVLVATLEACDADDACRADVGGSAIAAYDALAQRLDAAPVEFAFPLSTGQIATRTLGLSELETAVSSTLYSEGERMLLQRAVAAAANGDFVPLARLFALALGLNPDTLEASPDPTYSDAAYYAVTCADYAYFEGTPEQRARQYLRAGDAVDRAVPRMNSVYYGDLPCAFWPRASETRVSPPAYEPGFATLIPTLVLGATADPATPVGQGEAVFDRLNNSYLITQRGGPHVIYNRGNACPDDIVNALLVDGTQPARAEIECEGVVADPYVALAPRDAAEYADVLDALMALEAELLASPEFLSWDGRATLHVGCARGGAVSFLALPSGATQIALNACAISHDFAVTGRGRDDVARDRFTLDATLDGRWSGALRYAREGERYRADGTVDDTKIDLSR